MIVGHDSKTVNTFDGGFRVISNREINAVINAGLGKNPKLNTQDLRVYCALVERWQKEKPTIADLRKVLKGRDRSDEIRRSLNKIERVLEEIPEQKKGSKDIKASIPRRALRWVSQHGARFEILLVLQCGIMALRKQGQQFRVMTTKLAREWGCRQKTVSDAFCKLRDKEVIRDIDPLMRGANHPRTMQRYGKRCGWSTYQGKVVSCPAVKAPRVSRNTAYGPAGKPPYTDTHIHIHKSSYRNPTPGAPKFVNELLGGLVGRVKNV